MPELGWVGVDIFFALSGYLITGILLGLRSHPSQYQTFYPRRFIRILPPYFAVVLPMLALGRHGHWLPPHTARDQFLFLQAAYWSLLDPVTRSLGIPGSVALRR